MSWREGRGVRRRLHRLLDAAAHSQRTETMRAMTSLTGRTLQPQRQFLSDSPLTTSLHLWTSANAFSSSSPASAPSTRRLPQHRRPLDVFIKSRRPLSFRSSWPSFTSPSGTLALFFTVENHHTKLWWHLKSRLTARSRPRMNWVPPPCEPGTAGKGSPWRNSRLAQTSKKVKASHHSLQCYARHLRCRQND